MMKIDTAIADAYLKSEDVSRFSSAWLYTGRTERGVENIFLVPPDIELKREVVSKLKDEIVSHAGA